MSTLPFPETLNIPKRDIFLFVVCNSTPHWIYKQDFYQFKSRLLSKYAKEDGFDLQIIEKKCWTCNGTGIYKGRWSDDICWHCDEGIYSINQIMLRRYILNDRVFHEPDSTVPVSASVHSVIKGLITHPPVDYNPLYAYAELLYTYEPQNFFVLLNSIGKSLRTRALAKWKNIMTLGMLKGKTALNCFAEWLGFTPKPIEDELPF